MAPQSGFQYAARFNLRTDVCSAPRAAMPAPRATVGLSRLCGEHTSSHLRNLRISRLRFPKNNSLEILPAFLAGWFLVWWPGWLLGMSIVGTRSSCLQSRRKCVFSRGALMSRDHPLRSRRSGFVQNQPGRAGRLPPEMPKSQERPGRRERRVAGRGLLTK